MKWNERVDHNNDNIIFDVPHVVHETQLDLQRPSLLLYGIGSVNSFMQYCAWETFSKNGIRPFNGLKIACFVFHDVAKRDPPLGKGSNPVPARGFSGCGGEVTIPYRYGGTRMYE
jgi:hypothetical protein